MDAAQYARLLAHAVAVTDALVAARADAQSRPERRSFTAADSRAQSAIFDLEKALAREFEHTDVELDRDSDERARMARELRVPEAEQAAEAEAAEPGDRKR